MARWTRDRIIRDILLRHEQGLPLNCSKVGGIEPTFYQAAARLFGSWKNAVVAAGLPQYLSRSNSEWTPARILNAIRSLARRREPLNAGEVKSQYGLLVPNARRYFGSWNLAIAAAGVAPQRLRHRQAWTEERVIECILLRALRNESLQRRMVKPRALADAGTKLFGSWRAALLAAGIDDIAANRLKAIDSAAHPVGPLLMNTEVSRKASKRWTHDSALTAVIQRAKAGMPMHATAVYDDNRSLYRACLKYYGCWNETLAAAQLKSNAAVQ
jgi:hypothetical protein